MVKKVSCEAELKAEFQTAGSKLVVVDFFATWCGPCKVIAPKLEEMAKEYSDKLVVLKVDIDEADDLSREYNIEAMPTFIFFKNGSKVDMLLGANEQELRSLVQKNL